MCLKEEEAATREESDLYGQGFQQEDCNPLEDGDLGCWFSGLSHSTLFVVVLKVQLEDLAGEAYFV